MPWLRLLLLAAAMSLPLSAAAQFAAVTTQAANMRAGPDRSFPLVGWLPAGTPVNVVGCTDGWRWCDVIWGFNRGWIFARFLSMAFRNQPTVIFNSGAMLGVPLGARTIATVRGGTIETTGRAGLRRGIGRRRARLQSVRRHGRDRR